MFVSICSHHDKIIGLAKKIEKHQFTKVDTVDEANDLLWDLGDIANDIRLEAECAKESGQKMEDRLSSYKGAIEDLGFKRIK